MEKGARRSSTTAIVLIIVVTFFMVVLGLKEWVSSNSSATTEPKLNKIGITVPFNHGRYTVKEVKESNEYNGQKTENKFVIVTVEVENSSNKPIFVSGDQFVLIDEKGNNYLRDGMRDASFGEKNPTFSITDDLNPGVKRTGNVSFEVPVDVTDYQLAVRDNMFDFGGAEYIYFDLRR